MKKPLFVPLILQPDAVFLFHPCRPRVQTPAIRSRNSFMIFFSSLEMYDCEMPR